MPVDLTVILCTFNRASFLPRALQSLAEQKVLPAQVLIIDDGSTDGTEKVLAELVADLPMTEVFSRKQNGGIGAARNIALARARTEWLTFLDSDDAYAPEHLSNFAGKIGNDTQTDLFYGTPEVIGDREVIDKDYPHRKIDLDQCIVGGTFLFRRKKALSLGGFPEEGYGDDSRFFARAKESGWNIQFLGQTGYRYFRDHEDCLTKTSLS